MEYIEQIERTECIGNSLTKINSNFANLDEVAVDTKSDLETLATTVQQISSLNGPFDRPQFKMESTFTYGANLWTGTPGLVNQWTDLITSSTKPFIPLKVVVSVPNQTRLALITARVHLRSIHNPTSSWVRLGVFNSTEFGVDPIEVLDIAGIEGMTQKSFGVPINLQAVYMLEPNLNYVFGVQTFFHRSARTDKYSSVIVNGWELDDSVTEQLANTKNLATLQDVKAVNYYAGTGTGTNRMGKNKKYGYTDPSLAIQKEIKNISMIRATIL